MKFRRIGIAVSAATLLFTGSALAATSAHATVPVDINLNGVPTDIGPLGCGIPGDVVITGNGHEHFYDNGHATGTVTGSAVNFAPGDPQDGLWVGRGTAWFGVSPGGKIFNDIAEVSLTNVVTGQTVKINATDSKEVCH